MPEIKGKFAHKAEVGEPSGAFYGTVRGGGSNAGDFQGWREMGFKASKSNSSYGASNTVQPASLMCQYLIKY